MNFRTYPKLPRRPEASGATVGGTWVALEKVHGAQLVVSVTADEVRFGKRKAWLTDDDAFFGWRLVRTELAARARSLAEAVGSPQLWLYA
ncbi:MAG: RNA ligase, partial [Myxococcota bacterium]